MNIKEDKLQYKTVQNSIIAICFFVFLIIILIVSSISIPKFIELHYQQIKCEKVESVK